MSHSGTTIASRYAVKDIIGKGAMGVVHRARDLHTNATVAVKFLRPEMLRDPGVVARFEGEAKIARALRHTNIGQILDSGRAGTHYYLVMQLVPGSSLSTVMQTPMHVGLVMQIVDQLLDALAHAHDAGLIHRDLKPDNIILDGDHPRIVDFGIAIRREHAQSYSAIGRLTGEGQVLGTPEYMAPEQARAEAIDHRVDLFALGVIMYTLLTGKMPFDGKGMKVTLENMSTPTPRMRERAPEVAVDPLLEVFARWLMAKNPGSRPRSAAEARTVLRMIATNRDMAAMCMPAGPETQATLSPAMIAACRFSLRNAV